MNSRFIKYDLPITIGAIFLLIGSYFIAAKNISAMTIFIGIGVGLIFWGARGKTRLGFDPSQESSGKKIIRMISAVVLMGVLLIFSLRIISHYSNPVIRTFSQVVISIACILVCLIIYRKLFGKRGEAPSG